MDDADKANFVRNAEKFLKWRMDKFNQDQHHALMDMHKWVPDMWVNYTELMKSDKSIRERFENLPPHKSALEMPAEQFLKWRIMQFECTLHDALVFMQKHTPEKYRNYVKLMKSDKSVREWFEKYEFTRTTRFKSSRV